MKRCMYCGCENDDSSETCVRCGNPLIDMPKAQTMPAQEVPEDGTQVPEEGTSPDVSDIKISEEPLDELRMGMSFEPGGQAPYYGPQEQPWQQVQQQYGGQAYGYQQQVQYGDSQDAQTRDYGTRMQPEGVNRPLLLKARRWVRSPLFFIVVLLYTLKVVSSAANLMIGNLAMSLAALQATIGFSAAGRFITSIVQVLQQMSPVTQIAVGAVLSIPGLLICLGMWMTFFMTSPKKTEISTSGITLVKVVVIIKFVVYCILLAAGLVISVAFVVAAGAAASIPSIIVGVVMLAAMIVISVLLIMFYVLYVYALNAIRRNVKNGTPGRISAFVPAMGLVLCALNVLSMLPMAPNDYLGLLSRLMNVLWLLSASIWMFAYRRKTR